MYRYWYFFWITCDLRTEIELNVYNLFVLHWWKRSHGPCFTSLNIRAGFQLAYMRFLVQRSTDNPWDLWIHYMWSNASVVWVSYSHHPKPAFLLCSRSHALATLTLRLSCVCPAFHQRVTSVPVMAASLGILCFSLLPIYALSGGEGNCLPFDFLSTFFLWLHDCI
jgi:hypothetical protein